MSILLMSSKLSRFKESHVFFGSKLFHIKALVLMSFGKSNDSYSVSEH